MNTRKMLDILEESIKKEEEIYQYYKNMSKILRNASLASLFDSLSEEETEHKKLLLLQCENIKSSEEIVKNAVLTMDEDSHDNLNNNEAASDKRSDKDEMKVAKKAIKVFSSKAEELWKKQVSFEQEIELAAEIQTNLLPRNMPESEDLEIYATAMMSRKIGGDYFDFYLNNKRQLFFVIGDVMGKGIPAALLMSSLRALWRSGTLQNLSPRNILEKINEGCAEDFRVNGSFATLFSACYVPVKSSLWFSNAGHDPPLYVPKGRDEAISLTTPGVVIGISPDSKYKQKVQKMASGDLILFYSDGLWEITDPDKAGLYNREKISKQLIENRDKSPEEIISLILSQVRGLSGNIPQRDDITLVLMKKK